MKAEAPDIRDPFSQLETGGEIAGFIYRTYGPEGLKALLIEAKVLGQTFLESTAKELAEAGMMKAASLVTEAAKSAPILTETCPYEAGTANARSWEASKARRDSTPMTYLDRARQAERTQRLGQRTEAKGL